jgi:phosphoglycolate phosphatase
MPQVKAVVFDLDGTLLDSLGDIADSANEVLSSRGYATFADDSYRYFVGEGVRELFYRALPAGDVNEDIVQGCMDDFKQVYRRRWNIRSVLYDGIAELLVALVGRGIRMAVLSNKPHEATLRCVNHFLADHPFDHVFGQREGVPRKPDPTAANEIKSSLSLTGEQCLYVGDTATDMQTAVGSEMIAVGVEWGFRPREELLENGARHLVQQPSMLLELVG